MGLNFFAERSLGSSSLGGAREIKEFNPACGSLFNHLTLFTRRLYKYRSLASCILDVLVLAFATPNGFALCFVVYVPFLCLTLVSHGVVIGCLACVCVCACARVPATLLG